MDAALQLKIDLDKHIEYSDSEILAKLSQSSLVQELTADMPDKPLAMVWRLICISEIPFSNKLDYTQQLIAIVYERLATPYGFSLSGNEKMFLPCYNAMIVSALCRLGRAHDQQVVAALNWVNAHQPMERGEKVNIPGFNFDKYGGCFNKTPCYIGLAKSVIALQNFKQATGSNQYDAKLQMGTDYILRHKFYKRLSKDAPISEHITDISFPESYHLNVVELIRFAKDAELLEHPQTKDLIELLNSKRTKAQTWNVNFRYKAEGYTVFDKSKKSGEWVTYILENH